MLGELGEGQQVRQVVFRSVVIQLAGTRNVSLLVMVVLARICEDHRVLRATRVVEELHDLVAVNEGEALFAEARRQQLVRRNGVGCREGEGVGCLACSRLARLRAEEISGELQTTGRESPAQR